MDKNWKSMGPGRWRREFPGRCFLHVSRSGKRKWKAQLAMTMGERFDSPDLFHTIEEALKWGGVEYVQQLGALKVTP